MRLKLLKIVVVLLIGGSDAWPQRLGRHSSPIETTETSTEDGWKPVVPVSTPVVAPAGNTSLQTNDTQRHMNNFQLMDQSLRTVATQLLNATAPVEKISKVTKTESKTNQNAESSKNKLGEKPAVSLVKEINSEISAMESMGVGFGRPLNSKFGYFELSHPGQAMAITEEELEREMSSTKLMTGYKNPSHPSGTTSAGISTWILLNPPSTTTKPPQLDKTNQKVETEIKFAVKPVDSVATKIETVGEVPKEDKQTVVMEKVTTVSGGKTTVNTTKRPLVNIIRKTTPVQKVEEETSDSEILEKSESALTTRAKIPVTVATTTEATTTKKINPTRATSKVKPTGVKSTSKSSSPTTPRNVAKTVKPNAKPKPTGTRKTTVKQDGVRLETTSSSRIEKVTFRPMQIITTTKSSENSDKPSIFITKIKTSIVTNSENSATSESSTSQPPSTTQKINFTGSDLNESPAKLNKSSNNVIKVHLKKPIEDTTNIEIAPIRINAPVLTIEKIEKDTKTSAASDDDLENSKIDLKFDFNPELTKIKVETVSDSSSTTTTTTTTNAPSSTTKRRTSSKRKKNKNRRRKPSTTTVAPTSSSTTLEPSSSTATQTTSIGLSENSDIISTETIIASENDLQESKIAPETKISSNSTKTNKKKQPQKAIGTQIYNFLSREVMPSFGMMSLVGLGLGLASYFLYPFGGGITRRNYEVEPNNYKYNMDEYGGSYGQSEEEVLSKVFQGMTNHENKYGSTKNVPSNYYHYQRFDGNYDVKANKKTEQGYPTSMSTLPLYRPGGNTAYRNTDYVYSELGTTPTFYERQKQPAEYERNVAEHGHRQFVVGNLPKDYPSYEGEKLPAVPTAKNKFESVEGDQPVYQPQAYTYPQNSVAGQVSYDRQNSQTPRPDETYEEIEITPTAVAVEHGPRSLRLRRSIPRRFRRDSVIQVIPSKHELEEEEKEEDLSNEILDIIDSAIPGHEKHTKHNLPKKEDNEVEDLQGQKRKQQEESKTRFKTSLLNTKKTTEKIEPASEQMTSTTEAPKVNSDPTEKAAVDTSSTTSASQETTVDATTFTTTEDDKWNENYNPTTEQPSSQFNIFNFVKKVAEIKFRLGLTILKHASEGFARYLGHVQKRINGEE